MTREQCKKLQIVPLTFREANAFVAERHRHHRPTVGCKFVIGLAANGQLCGALIAGRPTARMSDNGWTLEVTRCCTDGTRNACSMLYRAAVRAAWAMGYKRVITYTLPEEGGASLRGAGFKSLGERGGGLWNRTDRPRNDTHPTQTKFGWEVTA